mgnify:CR=1 FL=1
MVHKKPHPLLAWRLKHPVPIIDDIKEGDMIVLKTWENNPSKDPRYYNPMIRRARMNFPYFHREVQMLQRKPIRVLKVAGEGLHRVAYVNMAKYLGRTLDKNDHGKRWLLLSDVRKV